MNKILLNLIILLIILIFLFCLLFWKLFPLSPFAVGFKRYELKNTVIFIENNNSIENFYDVDNYISSIELFHDLKFRKKPQIYIFTDKNSFLRKNITKARFYAYPNNKLVVSPWAINESKQGIISLELYIKHELSHLLLYQNINIQTVFNYPQWLLEGIAVYSVDQMGTSIYPTKKKTLDIIKNGTYFPPYLWKTSKEDPIKLNIKDPIAFKYSEFACIVEFLVEKYGKDKFLIYIKRLLTNNNHNKIFKDIYGIDFNDFLNDFIKMTEATSRHFT